MTESQFEILILALKDLRGDIPTWLSLLFGAMLSILGSIIFDTYKNYKRIEEIKSQITVVENRLVNYLDFLIPDNDNAYKKNELVLDVNQKVEDSLIQLINLKDSINVNTNELNNVLINSIYIKQYVALSELTGSIALTGDMIISTKEKASEIKNIVIVK